MLKLLTGKLRCAVALAALAALSTQAHAASTSNNNLNVSVTVKPACTISVTDMNFGTLSTVTGAETATSTLSVVCPAFTVVNVNFAPTVPTGLPTKTDVMTNAGGATIGFTMKMAGYYYFGPATNLSTTITGQLQAKPNPVPGAYKAVEIAYVIY